MIYVNNANNLIYVEAIVNELLGYFSDEFSVRFSKAKMVTNDKKLPWKNVSIQAMGGPKLMKFGRMKIKTKIWNSELILWGYLFSFCSYWAPKLT